MRKGQAGPMTHEELQAIKARAEAATPDVPRLIDEVERLRGENEQMTAVIAAEKKSADEYVAAFDAEVDRRATAEAEVERLRGALTDALGTLSSPIAKKILGDHGIEYCSACGRTDIWAYCDERSCPVRDKSAFEASTSDVTEYRVLIAGDRALNEAARVSSTPEERAALQAELDAIPDLSKG